jgi:hypothetical protein
MPKARKRDRARVQSAAGNAIMCGQAHATGRFTTARPVSAKTRQSTVASRARAPSAASTA